jgi:carbohydrate kinase (thermoresistant glucokinase family)
VNGRGSAPAPLVVVLGVSGSGKSTIGAVIAERLGVPFADADSLHSAANIAKMAAGIPLDDADREPWLQSVGGALARAAVAGTGLVMACSALKHAYRQTIRTEAPGVMFVHLHGTREVLAQRLKARSGHFMPLSLLDSQLATLEPLGADEQGIVVDIHPPCDSVAADAVSQLASRLPVAAGPYSRTGRSA